MKVDFMIIGAQKCGTTTLARQLAAHPEVCFCQKKEPGFFNRTVDWQSTLPEYHSLYSPTEGQICGEGSTMYTFLPEWPETHHRLYAYNPDLKLIYVMRQPVERIISNYAHRVVRNTVAEKPETAVWADPVFINRSRYSVQIKPYLELFPKENIFLLIFEEYVTNQQKHLEQLASFLNISPDGFLETAQEKAVHQSVGESQLSPWVQKVRRSAPIQAILPFASTTLRKAMRNKLGNKLDTKPEFSPTLKQLLWRFLEDDVCNIESIMGRRLSIWREGYEG
jgi:hypothetical protein